jgi:hypothetical protein
MAGSAEQAPKTASWECSSTIGTESTVTIRTLSMRTVGPVPTCAITGCGIRLRWVRPAMAGRNWSFGQGAGRGRCTSNKKPQPGSLQAGLFFGRSPIRYEARRPDGGSRSPIPVLLWRKPSESGIPHFADLVRSGGGTFFAAREAMPTRTQWRRPMLVGAENAID